jgi:hypothetical protein
MLYTRDVRRITAVSAVAIPTFRATLLSVSLSSIGAVRRVETRIAHASTLMTMRKTIPATMKKYHPSDWMRPAWGPAEFITD